MALAIISGWLTFAGLAWWLHEESCLNDFGKVQLSDRVFFIFISLVGAPLSLLIAAVSYSPKNKRGPRIVRRRDRAN